MGLNKEQIMSIIRYTLTTVGVSLVTSGTISETLSFQLTGAIIALVSGIWSIIDKTDANIKAKADALQAK
jgi:hypothetical protein